MSEDKKDSAAVWKERALTLIGGAVVAGLVMYFTGFFEGKTRRSNVSPGQIEFTMRKLALDSLRLQYLPDEEMRVDEIWINANQSCISGRVTSTRGKQRFLSRGGRLVTVESPIALNFEADWAACRVPEPLKAL